MKLVSRIKHSDCISSLLPWYAPCSDRSFLLLYSVSNQVKCPTNCDTMASPHQNSTLLKLPSNFLIQNRASLTTEEPIDPHYHITSPHQKFRAPPSYMYRPACLNQSRTKNSQSNWQRQFPLRTIFPPPMMRTPSPRALRWAGALQFPLGLGVWTAPCSMEPKMKRELTGAKGWVR